MIRCTGIVFVLAVALLALVPAGSLAHFPGLYGRKFVRTVQAPPTTPELPAALPDDPSLHEKYKQQILAQETTGGAYGNGLAEPLLELAGYYQARMDYDAAIDQYERSLQIVRVNAGLYSEQQIPIVRKIMGVHRAAGDLAGLDARYQHYFRLYGGGHPPFTPLRRLASLEYLRWQRSAHVSGLDGGGNRRLASLYRLNSEMLESLDGESDAPLALRRELVLNQIMNLYLVLGTENLADGNVPRSSRDSSQYVHQQMTYVQRVGVYVGVDLLQDLIAASNEEPPTERAGLHLELGDWYQWNEMRDQAEAQYRQVELLLTEAGESELLDRWLGEPVELPANGAFQFIPQKELETPPHVISVTFDLDAKGQVDKVAASTESPDAKSAARRIKRMLRQTHFRPRFRNGAAEGTSGVSRRYQLLEQIDKIERQY